MVAVYSMSGPKSGTPSPPFLSHLLTVSTAQPLLSKLCYKPARALLTATWRSALCCIGPLIPQIITA
jgi:hypothetical protein